MPARGPLPPDDVWVAVISGGHAGMLGACGRHWRGFVGALMVTSAVTSLGVAWAPVSAQGDARAASAQFRNSRMNPAEERAWCAQAKTASSTRESAVVGSAGPKVLVIGDSWSLGRGLDQESASWPSALDGAQVRVDGFSGSGYAAIASPCSGASFGQRALQAARRDFDLVIVQGGLNDTDCPADQIRAGVRAVLAAFDGTPVILVGPSSAPARRLGVPRVEELLEAEAELGGARYVSSSEMSLPYLDDGLHLTREGHQRFGEFVEAALG